MSVTKIGLATSQGQALRLRNVGDPLRASRRYLHLKTQAGTLVVPAIESSRLSEKIQVVSVAPDSDRSAEAAALMALAAAAERV
jgi:hypothetical protein